MSGPEIVASATLSQMATSVQPEPTAAAFEDVIFYTASRWHAVSTDAGASFSRPWAFTGAVFGGNDGKQREPKGDESVIFAPMVDRFIWAMLYTEKDGGSLTLRIAFAGPAEVRNGATSWAYLDLHANGLNRPGFSFDYPQLAVTPGHLYVTANLFKDGQRTQIVLRFPLSGFRELAPHQVGFQYFLDDSNYFFGPVQSCVSRFFWGQHITTGLFRVWAWEEASGAISSCDVPVPRWNDTDYDTRTSDGNNWLDSCSPRPVGTMHGTDIIFAWSAGRDHTTQPNPTPYPFVYLLHVTPDGDGFKRSGTRYLWNPEFAFAIPSLATLDDRVALNCEFGGPTRFPTALLSYLELPFHHSSAFWQVVPAASESSATRWGDYVTLRPWYRTRDHDRLAATTYTIDKDLTSPGSSPGWAYTPRFYGFV